MAYTDIGNRSTYIPGSPLRRRVPAPAAKMPMSQIGGFMGAPGMNMNGGNQVGMFHPGPSAGPGSPESIVTPQMNAQIAEMQARMRQQGRPLGTAGIRSFGASPNSGTFGMGSPAAPQPDGTRLGDAYAAAMGGGPGGGRLTYQAGQINGPQFGQEARVDLGPTDQYGLRRPLGTGNIDPVRGEPGLLGAAPNTQDKFIGTLPGGAMVQDYGGVRQVVGPNVDQSKYDLSTKSGRNQAMRESNARWWASEAGKKQAEYLQKKQAARDANKSALRQAFMAQKMGIPAGRGMLRTPSAVPSQPAPSGYGPPVVTAPREPFIPGLPPGTVWPNPEADVGMIGMPGWKPWNYWLPAPPKRKIIPNPSGRPGAIPGPYPEAGF